MLIAAAVLGALLVAHAGRIAAQRARAPRLPEAPEPVAGTSSEAVILLPVRDEEENVEPCLASLLAQTACVGVRVIDDGSRDRTVELVQARIAGSPIAQERIELIPAGELPEGWSGKVHALAVGCAGLDCEWILTTDADTRHAPELLARALAAARRGRFDLLSVAGHQVVAGVGEGLVTPGVFALLDDALGDWRPHFEGSAESAAVANGQFMLLRRSALAAIGGFERIREAALDDVALADTLATAGFRTAFVRAPELLAVRMYRGFTASWRGWRRNLALIYGARPFALRRAVVRRALPGLAAFAFAAGGHWPAALLTWGCGVASSALLRATSRHPLAHAWLWPLDDFTLAALLTRARRDFQRRRLATWKGRAIAAQPGDSGAS